MLQNKFQSLVVRSSCAMLALTLLLAACSTPTPPTPAAMATLPAATATLAAPTAAPTAVPTAVPTKAPTAAPTASGPTLTVSGVAQSFTSQVVAAKPAGDNGPYWETLPQYTLLTLVGYPVSNHLLKPQIFIFPVKELASTNEGAGKIAASLQTLLQNQQAGKYLPFLPLFNAAQAMHAQVKYLDFKNGKGVRFITQFDQAPLPINNHELFYTFQGLSSDGKYYVAVVLPVTLASLPADEKVSEKEAAQWAANYLKYLETITATLNQQPAAAFSPDLSKLDALVQSIEVK